MINQSINQLNHLYFSCMAENPKLQFVWDGFYKPYSYDTHCPYTLQWDKSNFKNLEQAEMIDLRKNHRAGILLPGRTDVQ